MSNLRSKLIIFGAWGLHQHSARVLAWDVFSSRVLSAVGFRGGRSPFMITYFFDSQVAIVVFEIEKVIIFGTFGLDEFV